MRRTLTKAQVEQIESVEIDLTLVRLALQAGDTAAAQQAVNNAEQRLAMLKGDETS